jgi:hypothetical protein
MNYTLIILGTVVVILLYILYKYYVKATTNSLVSGSVSIGGNLTQVIITDNPTSYKYTYSAWIYINTWDTTSSKVIFQRRSSSNSNNYALYPDRTNYSGKKDSGTNNDTSIALYIDPSSPTLYCLVKTGGGTNDFKEIRITDNFPIQSWCFVAISASQNYLDLYINGKLVKSMNITLYAPPTNNNNINIGNNNTSKLFDANMTKFIYKPSASSPQEVYNSYLAGNGTSKNVFSKYGVNIDLTKNGTITNTYTLLG